LTLSGDTEKNALFPSAEVAILSVIGILRQLSGREYN